VTIHAVSSMDADEDLDLRAVFERLLAARTWLVGCVVVATGAFVAIALLMEPLYRATVTAVPTTADNGNSSEGTLGKLAALAGGDFAFADSRAQEALAVLRSREFTQRFVEDLQLMPRMYADVWDEARDDWRVGEERPTLAEACRDFGEMMNASIDAKSGLVKVYVEWSDPALAALWANELVARLNRDMRKRAIDRAAVYMGYLQRQLNAAPEVTTRLAIGRLMEAQIRESMLATVTEEYAFRVVDRALVPDVTDRIRPRRALLVMIGALVGLFVGLAGVFVRSATQPHQ
jgi:uncharacterized protein involved in exopolysaccharide biosynthesis